MESQYDDHIRRLTLVACGDRRGDGDAAALDACEAAMIKRLTNEEADKIIAARQAKIRQARAERIKRLEAEALRMMQGRQGQDYIPDETAERQLAEKIIAAYMDDVEEASFAELREVLQQFAIDPRLVMTIAKGLLARS